MGTPQQQQSDHGHPHESSPRGRYLLGLALGALGVVYGDLGTSPLYALRECFHGLHAIAPTPTNIFGVLSLIFWGLMVVVTIKYMVFILRADNRGEGGILALTALATPIRPLAPSPRRWLVLLGVFGAALLYGDGIITPTISVLSAVEGLKVATPVLDPFVIPLTLGILVALFLIQSRGTARIGQIFGPVMLVWFAVLALLGVVHIAQNPAVLAAISPAYALTFFATNGWTGFLVLGTVVLALTGVEALYADMGHFGRRPIRLAWWLMSSKRAAAVSAANTSGKSRLVRPASHWRTLRRSRRSIGGRLYGHPGTVAGRYATPRPPLRSYCSEPPARHHHRHRAPTRAGCD